MVQTSTIHGQRNLARVRAGMMGCCFLITRTINDDVAGDQCDPSEHGPAMDDGGRNNDVAGNLPVTVVTVCYSSTHVLPGLLTSLPRNLDIVLVDNASSDNNALRGLALQHRAQLLEMDQNVGFGVACNQGAKIAKTPYILFLNPDVTVEPGAVERLLEAAGKHPDALAFNPAIRAQNGTEYFKRGSVLLPKHAWLRRGWPEADCEVPILTGAALLVRSQAFYEVGGFDPEIFLYHEDDDLALRLSKIGRLFFVRGAVVRHLSGHSTPKNASTVVLKAWHMGRSRVYAARKHAKPNAFSEALIQALLQLASPIALFSSRKRKKSWYFLRGVLSARNSQGRMKH